MSKCAAGRSFRGWFIVASLLTAIAFGSAETLAGPLDIQFPGKWVAEMIKKDFNEPSGLCWHQARGTLFVVGDEGHLGEVSADGKLIRVRRIRHADFEGITHDPVSGRLYVVVEGDDVILEVDPDTFTILREFEVPRKYDGQTLLSSEGQGLEGITFVPQQGHSEGGFFYVSNQAFTLDDKNDISGIFQVVLPLRSKNEPPKLIGYFAPAIIDLSGLFYDPKTEHTFVISDEKNIMIELGVGFEIMNVYALPGDDQEGLTMDDEGHIYIAQDSGGIIKWAYRTKRK